MKNLNEYGLVEVIHQVVEKRIPFLGICLGLQLLFEKSDESEGVKGLGIFKRRGLQNSGSRRVLRFRIWDGTLCIFRMTEDSFGELKRTHMYISCILIT